MPQPTERRCLRIEEPSEALGRFLHTASLRLGYGALVLGDSGGHLIAWGGDVDGPDQLAGAAAARFASGVGRSSDSAREDSPLVEPLPTAAGTYYLTVVGGRSAEPLRRDGTLQGIRRILGL